MIEEILTEQLQLFIDSQPIVFQTLHFALYHLHVIAFYLCCSEVEQAANSNRYFAIFECSYCKLALLDPALNFRHEICRKWRLCSVLGRHLSLWVHLVDIQAQSGIMQRFSVREGTLLQS